MHRLSPPRARLAMAVGALEHAIDGRVGDVRRYGQRSLRNRHRHRRLIAIPANQVTAPGQRGTNNRGGDNIPYAGAIGVAVHCTLLA